MGSPKTPEVVHPGEAAVAATGAAGAGEMMSVANQPVEQYGNLATMTQLGPAEMATQQAISGQAALQAAQQQKDIQSRVDPLAYAQREMRLGATTKRLGELTGIDPSQVSYRAPGAYDVANLSNIPSISDLAGQSRDIASNLSTAGLSKSGANPRIIDPRDAQTVTPLPSRSYLG